MKLKIYSQFTLRDTVIAYQLDADSGQVGLLLYPKAKASQLVARRTTLDGRPELESQPAGVGRPLPWNIDSFVQLRVRGDEAGPGYPSGRTMRGGLFIHQFRLKGQRVRRDSKRVVIITTLVNVEGHECEHHLEWRRSEGGLRCWLIVRNRSAKPLTIEMASSFSIGGLTPFAADDAPGSLVLHRFRSFWAAEGRHESAPLESYHMERSWGSHAVTGERFGQVGTMPVRGFFPFIALEDTRAGVFWGAQLAWAGSWQLEVWRKDDAVSISGGLADREFGHWFQTLPPGALLETPVSHIATGAEDFDTFCQRLTAMQEAALETLPKSEKDLPILFNEYCTTWGVPSEANLLQIAERLHGTPVRYLVADAGWYLPESGSWNGTHGDWIPSRKLFPSGMASTMRQIRKLGFVPGIWFELETCGPQSEAYTKTEHLVKLDGQVITHAGRRFWDLTDPWVVNYLSQRVIRLMKSSGIGYIKVDYNNTLGIGCDGAESPGAGLIQQVEGIYAFFRRMRQALPELVIENCSSGGHRLEPSMLALSSMSSFSDAHETLEIPLIAASLHRLILPSQSQIWAVLRANDTPNRLAYSLVATFLGRMCLSGDITQLDAEQWTMTQAAMDLYRKCVPVIRRGISKLFGPEKFSFRYTQGWQAVRRVDSRGQRALVVLHAFDRPIPRQVTVPLPPGKWTLEDSLIPPGDAVSVTSGKLVWRPRVPFTAAVVLLRRPLPRAK